MIAEEFNPITVWQSQTSLPAPTMEQIDMRARSFERKNRRRNLVFCIALSMHLGVSLVEDATDAKGAIWWIGVLRFALFITWVAYIPFRSHDKDASSLTFLRIVALTPVLEFYRKQLEQQRDYFQDDYRRKTQFIAIGAGFILYSIFYPSLFLVFGIPIVIGAAVFYKRRRDELPEIRRELAELRRLQKEESQ
jgi:hypothetical protein